MRLEYDSTINDFREEKRIFKKKKTVLENRKQYTKKEILNQNNILIKNQEQTLNLEAAINNINKNLKNIGITDFMIKKQDSSENNINSYHLIRSSSNDARFNSLSEGEKTIISFLYFLELCQGKTSKQEISDRKIIVIDDPISSLSHIYIFNIAQFIEETFFNDHKIYKKIFILTHNLYFFNELARYTKNNRNKNQTKLFRIVKNQYSKIIPMKEDEIKNDYESYWQILKDYETSNQPHPILPNVMRNILEHFFGFINKSNFLDELNKLDTGKYRAFIRYMNRESHFDRENINDKEELDHSLFFHAFKEVFKQSKHQEHYDKMMDISDTADRL